ncbi:MAG: ECF transporter S component [Anaerolineales bacterium]
MKTRWAGTALLTTSALFGLGLFFYPFFVPAQSSTRLLEMPLSLTVLLLLCLLILLYEAQSAASDPRLTALLGMLVAINAALRFAENLIPGPGGFSPIFFLIVLVGYVFGARLGFLMGALTLLVSALITGGVGPWLPGQMFAAGWVGLSAAALRPVGVRLSPRAEVWLLAMFGALWGFAFGALMNLWTFPFIAAPLQTAAATSMVDLVRRYAAYYLLTSLTWDFWRALGNLALTLALGAATLKALRRFKARFIWRMA